MKRILNIHINDFLMENGIQPEYETLDGASYYEYSPELLSLLDSYYIQYTCIPHRKHFTQER